MRSKCVSHLERGPTRIGQPQDVSSSRCRSPHEVADGCLAHPGRAHHDVTIYLFFCTSMNTPVKGGMLRDSVEFGDRGQSQVPSLGVDSNPHLFDY